LLIFGVRIFPAIFLGAFFVNITTAGGIFTSLGIAFGNTLEGLAASYLVGRFAKGVNAFDAIEDIFKYVFFAASISTGISASIGVLTLILGHLAKVGDFWPVWLTWWLGDMGGALVIAPFFIVWAIHPRIKFSAKGALNLFVSILATLIVTELIFLNIIPFVYLCIPLGVWVAFWFGRRGAVSITLLVAIISIFNTIHGFGPFSNKGSINASLILLQVFLGVFSVTAITFAATILQISKSKKAIAQQEEKFKILIEKSFDAVVLIDISSKILYASPSVLKILGYTADELIGKAGFDLVLSDDRDYVMKILASLVSKPGESVTVEYRTVRKDKEIIWVEATGTNLLLDPLVNAVVINFRDVTERKHSEERFRALVEKSGQGIALIDKNGKILYTTESITDLLGYSQEEYEKLPPGSTTHPDDAPLIQEKSKEILNKPGASVSIQYRVKHKNGEYKWFDVLATNLIEDEAVHAYVVNFRDITDIKKREEEERKEKIQDEAMLGSIGDGVIATDSTGQITLINRRALEMLGWNQVDIIGKNIVDVITLEDELGKPLTKDERPITKVLSLGKPIITSSTIFYVRKDKTKFPVHFTVTPIILENKVIGAIEIFHDVTQEKEVDKAKSEFVSVASHQLRTPLATINWYLEELMEGTSNFSVKQLSYLKETYAASKRMVDLINALLNTSRLEMGTFVVEPGSVMIQDIVKQVLKDLAPKIEQKQVTIVENYGEHLTEMHADTKLLTIIIQNILSNAIKYTKPQDTISVKVTKDEKEFLIQISEHGVGIPKTQQDKIFTKLFRADNARMVEPEGTGLGLYIVNSIVNTTGGKIWFESEENKGTTFFVSFPSKGMQQKKGEKQLI
ncbi:MAG TPA: PAS domain S-box protein, partial [Patescibacteria group bacterium]